MGEGAGERERERERERESESPALKKINRVTRGKREGGGGGESISPQ